MIQSMTGYGKATVNYQEKKISIEIKSLNSKALDLSARIAPAYREKEMEIRQQVAAALGRGKVDLAIWTETGAGADATPINGKLVKAYYEQIRRIAEEEGVPAPQDPFTVILRLPDVMVKPESVELSDGEWAAVRQGLDEAIARLVAFRRQEGAALQAKFNEKISRIRELLASIEPLEKSRVGKIRQKIIDGLETIPEADYDKNRLEQELIYYIEKLDISEEKQRLGNHLDYFLKTMDEETGVGKKLGFIAQEMGREINTTGSKSNQAEMQNIVVRMKDELEQIKEQVLNVL